MKNLPYASRLGATALLLTLAGGCTGLLPRPAAPPAFYSLDGGGTVIRKDARVALVPSGTAPTLLVNPMNAAAGFDSQRIIYVRDLHKLEYFARSEWIDTPARMLSPQVVAAVENSGAFAAVVQAPSAAAGDIRLDTEILRLQHQFGAGPSSVRFTLRAYLVDSATRRVLASRDFDEIVASASENPYGGVVAANRAVENVLAQLGRFCAETAVTWRPQAGPETMRK